MRVISLYAAAMAGGSHLVKAAHDPAAVVALAALALSGHEGVAPDRAAVVEALAELEHCGAVQFLSPMVIDGGHVAWTPFFIELLIQAGGRAASLAGAEVRRRASHVDTDNPDHWTEICAALGATPFEGIVGDLTRGNCPYTGYPVSFLSPSQDGPADLLTSSVEAVQQAVIDGVFAQPVAHVTKSDKDIVTAATNSKRSTSRKSAGSKRDKAVAKKAARSK